MIDPKDEAFPTTSIKSLKLLVPHSLLVQYPFCTHKQKKKFFLSDYTNFAKRCKGHQKNICVLKYSVSARLEWVG